MLGSDFVIFDFVRHSSFVLRHSFMRSNAASQQPSGLVRALGPIDATMIVIGSMIGSGILSLQPKHRG